MEQDQQFVEYVLKAIVDHPDDVRVERTVDEMGVLMSVSVNPDDMGKIIGKSGQTAKAVRTLLKVVGAKNDARVNMKIIEPPGGGVTEPTGTDAVAVEPPVTEDQDAVEEVTEAQRESDATVPQPSENDQIVDEATGEPQAQEPQGAQDTDEGPPARKPDVLHERSPLDDL